MDRNDPRVLDKRFLDKLETHGFQFIKAESIVGGGLSTQFDVSTGQGKMEVGTGNGLTYHKTHVGVCGAVIVGCSAGISGTE